MSFAYEVADGRGGTDRALVTVQVVESDVPIAPIAVDDIAGPFSRGQGVTVNVLANDSDPDGRVADLTITSDDPLVPIAPDGTLSIAAPDDTVRLGYTVTDALKLQINVQNFTDEKYETTIRNAVAGSWAQPGPTRSVVGSLTYTF